MDKPKLDIVDNEGKKVDVISLPYQFCEELREDLIKRAFESRQSKVRMRYGASPEAGKRPSVRISKRRREYRGSYGYGISRVPRKIFSRRGRRMNWQAAFAPGTVKGRKAHPPKSSKSFIKNINKKENKKAIRSAIAATINIDVVKSRGHIVPSQYPVVLNGTFEKLDKTKSVLKCLITLGFDDELKRTDYRKVRAGKGKMRGRKYKHKKGPLIIVSDYNPIIRAAKNIPGVDAVEVSKLNIALLAPGSVSGRATIWTKSAIEKLEEKKLFL